MGHTRDSFTEETGAESCPKEGCSVDDQGEGRSVTERESNKARRGTAQPDALGGRRRDSMEELRVFINAVASTSFSAQTC